MLSKKVVPVDLTEEEIRQIHEALDLVFTKLNPYLINLSNKNRQKISGLHAKTFPFLNDTSTYLRLHPEFKSAYMNPDEYDKNLKSYGILKPITYKVKDLERRLDDTMLLTGDIAFHFALDYYRNVKQAAKLLIPGALSIFRGLGYRFKVKSSKQQDTQEKPSSEQNDIKADIP